MDALVFLIGFLPPPPAMDTTQLVDWMGFFWEFMQPIIMAIFGLCMLVLLIGALTRR